MSFVHLPGSVRSGRASSGASRWKLAVALASSASLLALLPAQSAFAASPMKDVVPKSGTVAGQPYPYWMTRTWELYYSSLAPGRRACTTVTVKGKAVTLVGNFSGGKLSKSTCHVPAGSAVYVNAYTTHCSTLEGEHEGFGPNASEVRKCALGVNKYTVRVGINAWLDGQQITKFGHNFWDGTPVFSVTVKEQEAQAAAWGWSLLLRPLPKGTHTVRIQVNTPKPAKKHLTESMITVHVS